MKKRCHKGQELTMSELGSSLEKLAGQPVPESPFVSELNRSLPQRKHLDTLSLETVIFAGEGRLCASFPGNLILLWRKYLPPPLVASAYLLRHASSSRHRMKTILRFPG